MDDMLCVPWGWEGGKVHQPWEMFGAILEIRARVTIHWRSSDFWWWVDAQGSKERWD